MTHEYTMVRRGERTLVLDSRGEVDAMFPDSGYGSRQAAEEAAARYRDHLEAHRELDAHIRTRWPRRLLAGRVAML